MFSIGCERIAGDAAALCDVTVYIAAMQKSAALSVCRS